MNWALFRSRHGRAVLALSIAALTILMMALVWLGHHQVVPRKAATIEARVELAAGNVTVERDGRKETVSSGTPLSPQCRLATAAGARALLRLQDGSGIFVRDATEVNLQAHGVLLNLGEIFVNAAPVEQKEQIHQAGEVTVAAADAGYSLSRIANTVTVTVTRGAATVSSAGGASSYARVSRPRSKAQMHR